MKTIRGVGLITLMCGVSTLIPQYLVAVNLGAELPAFAGSLVSLIVIVFMAKNRKEKPPLNWGCGRFPRLLYYASPHCWRYISGLTAPSDNFIRRSLYHLM